MIRDTKINIGIEHLPKSSRKTRKNDMFVIICFMTCAFMLTMFFCINGIQTSLSHSNTIKVNIENQFSNPIYLYKKQELNINTDSDILIYNRFPDNFYDVCLNIFVHKLKSRIQPENILSIIDASPRKSIIDMGEPNMITPHIPDLEHLEMISLYIVVVYIISGFMSAAFVGCFLLRMFYDINPKKYRSAHSFKAYIPRLLYVIIIIQIILVIFVVVSLGSNVVIFEGVYKLSNDIRDDLVRMTFCSSNVCYDKWYDNEKCGLGNTCDDYFNSIALFSTSSTNNYSMYLVTNENYFLSSKTNFFADYDVVIYSNIIVGIIVIASYHLTGNANIAYKCEKMHQY